MPSTGPRSQRLRTHPILLLAVGLTLAACGDAGDPDSGGPSTGTLVVSTSTGGNDPDPDGYWLTVDGLGSHYLDPAGTSKIDLPPGQHTLGLLGMAEQCSVSPVTPLDVDVPSRDTARVAFEVTCLATGVRITATTTGLDFDPDGYRVEVDGTDLGILPPNGTVLTRLDPGSHTIALTGVSPNCTIVGPGSHTLTIGDTEIAPIDFAAACTATSGVVGVVVQATGVDVDGAYEAMVDGARPFPVGPSQPGYTTGVSAGHHVISLVAPANCSVETEPQPVTVTAGGLIRDTVSVTFSVTCREGFGTLRITAPTTGTIPAHDYIVLLCDSGDLYYCTYFNPTRLGDLAPNGTLLTKVHPGIHRLLLWGVPPNCSVGRRSHPTDQFMVAAGDTLDIAFPVRCSP